MYLAKEKPSWGAKKTFYSLGNNKKSVKMKKKKKTGKTKKKKKKNEDIKLLQTSRQINKTLTSW